MFCHISKLSIQRTSTATKEYALRTSHYLCGGGGGGGGGPGLFFLEKRGGPKENFTMIWGVGHCVCFVKNRTHYNSCGRSK